MLGKHEELLMSTMIRMSGRMDKNTEFVPKGGMCNGCNKQMDDCSDLPFDSMYVIRFDSDDNIGYVRCTEHDPLVEK